MTFNLVPKAFPAFSFRLLVQLQYANMEEEEWVMCVRVDVRGWCPRIDSGNVHENVSRIDSGNDLEKVP